MRNTASGTRALAPTTPTNTPSTLDFLRDQLADAREQVDRLLATPPPNDVALAFYQGRVGAFELALAALEGGEE